MQWSTRHCLASGLTARAVQVDISDVPYEVVDNHELHFGSENYWQSLLAPPASDCRLGVDDGVAVDTRDAGIAGSNIWDVVGTKDGEGDDWSYNEAGVWEVGVVTFGDDNNDEDATREMASEEGYRIEIEVSKVDLGVDV